LLTRARAGLRTSNGVSIFCVGDPLGAAGAFRDITRVVSRVLPPSKDRINVTKSFKKKKQ
jgi:hypothetical protein